MYSQVLVLILKTSLFLSIIVSSSYAQSDFFNRMRNERIDSANIITWSQQGPGNGGMSDLVRYHPTVPDTIFFGPDMGGNYQSDNNGLSFYSVKDSDGDGGFNRLRDVSWSLSNENQGLALEASHLWRTVDRGKSWSLVLNCPWYVPQADGKDARSWLSKVCSIAIDPNNTNVWYIGSGKLTRGQIWDSSYKSATAANPRGPAHDISGRIWKTTNGGQTWTELTNGFNTAAQFGRIIVDPRNSQRVFAASNYGVYRSENGGASWINVGAGKLPNNTIVDLDYYHNGNTLVIYLIDQVRLIGSGRTTVSTGGVYRSSNSGNTWENINGNLAIDLTRLTGGISVTYNNYKNKWFGTPNNYDQFPSSIQQPLHLIQVDPSRPDSVYVGLNDPQGEVASFGPGILWATSNGGTTWTSVARAPCPAWENDRTYWTERGNPWNVNMTYGHEPFNQQWNSNYPWRTMRHFDVNARGDIMLISAHNTLLSTDRGVTWNQVDEDYTAAGNIMGRGNSDLPGETLGQDPRLIPGEIYLGSGEHRLWKTTLDGVPGREAMKLFRSSLDTISSIAFHPDDVKTVYITSLRQAGLNEMWRSTDGGDTFDFWGTATPGESVMRTRALTIDPINPQYMYFGITEKDRNVDFQKEGGFYFSSNGGRTFTPRNSGLPANIRVNDIEWDPRDSSYRSMFIAAQGHTFNVPEPSVGGLYYTANRGQSWSEINIHPEVDGVNEIKIDQMGRIYVTAGYRGSSVGGLWYSDNYGQTWTKTFDSAATECLDVSPFDPNLIVVNVGNLQKNPGVYLSEDRGVTWTKNNQVLAINHRISRVEFSIHEPSTLWLSGVGFGFSKGFYRNIEARKYDFGTSSSPVQQGWDRISPTTSTSSISWSQAPINRDRGAVNSANFLTRDLVAGDVPITLNCNVPNGEWRVTLKMGDAQFDNDDMAVKAEGVIKASGIDSKAGRFKTVNFGVNVSDGELNLEFSDGGGANAFWSVVSMVLTRPSSGTPTPGMVISLRGNNDKYVSSENGISGMRCNRNTALSWEKFTVVDAGGGKIALRGSNGKYVTSSNGLNPMFCNRDPVMSWEVFAVEVTGPNQIALKGSNGQYVSSENGTKEMFCNRAAIGAWEKFSWQQE